MLPPEVVEHIWSLPSTVDLTDSDIPARALQVLEQIKEGVVETTTEQSKKDALRLFDEQVDKLDTWAEDMKLGLEKEITELTQAIRLMKNEARKTDSIEARLAAQRDIKNSETLLKRKRADLFAEHDRIEEQKDQLTENLASLIALQTERQNLFALRWRII